MATYQELRARSQQVRDEQNIGGNTALRVGQLLMDIVKYFNDNDAAASEYLQQHFAMVNDGTHLLNWQQSPIVILHTMGETYDEGDFSSLSQGENYYRNGFIVEANGQGGGINGETPKANVLYVNLANDTLYTWNGSSFDAITSGGGGSSISGDDIIKNAYYSNGNLVLIIETEGGDKTVTIPVNFDASNYVPTSRTVNGKALRNNITLSQSDIPGLVAALAGKISGIKTSDNTPLTPDSNGIVTLPPAGSTISPASAAPIMDGTANVGSSAKYAREDHVHPHDSTKLSKSDVSVETQGDGTVDINVGSGANKDTYTINLNHTHEGMAKLVVDTAANLPDASEMESDTIYGELDDGEIATIYLGGYPFYGGGGSSSGPVLRRPADGATIDMGQTTSGTVSQTINVKGKSLTQALTIQLSGTGYSFGTTQPSGVTRDSSTQLTVTAAAANVLNGVDIVVVYTGNDTDEDASGTLGITSASPDNISTEATLVANKVTYEDLAGVKLTGTQWLQTDYYPNPNTEFRLECKFTANARTTNPSTGNVGAFLRCDFNSNTSEQRFSLHTASAGKTSTAAYYLFYWNKSSTDGQASINMESHAAEMVADHAVISYAKGSSAGTLTFNGGTPRSVSTTLQTETLTSPMCIGYKPQEQTIFNVFDLTIYSFIITENGQTVRHWVAKKRDGVPGLYDTITGSFISSETNDELVAIPLT